MTTLDDLRRAHQAQMDAKQDVLQSWPALLGRVSDGLVPVAGRPGYVHVRIGSDETAGQARNKKVPNTYDLAVYVGYDGISPEFQVLSTRQEDWVGAGYAPIPEVGPHGATHTWPTEGDAAADGSDVTYVAWRQILSLRIGTIAAFTVEVGRGPLFRVGTGQWEWIATQNINLAGDQPVIGARWVLVYLDSAGVLQRRLGAIIAPSNALVFSDCPAPLSEEFPLAAVRLYATQTAITETRTVQDVVDLRFQASGGGGTALPVYAQGSIIYGDATDWAALAHPGAANRVLQSTAAEVGWSAGSLVLGGFTLTVPATGTAALGTGAANQAAYWSGVNTLAGEAQLALSRGGSAADLSATGGAGEYVKQAGAGAAFTVGVIAVADLPAHDILSATHADTTPAAVVRGDLMTGQGVAPLWARLAHPGAINRVLQSIGLEIGWSANAVTFPAAGAVPVGAAAATQVAFWVAGSQIGGHAGFTYSAITGSLTVPGDYFVTDGHVIGNSAATARLVFDSSGAPDYANFLGCDVTMAGNLDVAGHVAVGAGVVVAANTALWSNINIGAVSAYGLQSTVTCDQIAANGSYNLGYYGGIIVTGAGNLTSAVGQFGVWGDIMHYSASVVTQTVSLLSRAVFVGAGATGSITIHHGIHVTDAGNAGGAAGSIGMQVGLYIEDLDFATTNYPIYSLGGDSYHAGAFAVGGTVAPAAQLHVDNAGTVARPVLYLDQGDVSEEMIEFATTIGVGNAIEAVGGKTLTVTHFIKVTLPGALTRYFPVGTIA